jgi:hypothetical protein
MAGANSCPASGDAGEDEEDADIFSAASSCHLKRLFYFY